MEAARENWDRKCQIQIHNAEHKIKGKSQRIFKNLIRIKQEKINEKLNFIIYLNFQCEQKFFVYCV